MFITIIAFFIVLSILVLVHELGHFLVAKYIGVEVEEFGMGLPPRIFGKKIKGTIYSINALPIGGFVKLKGEDEDDDSKVKSMSREQKSKYFWARSKKERSLILTAGVIMNFVLATVITTYFLIDGVKVPSDKVIIEQVIKGAPADQAGLKSGDQIISAQKKENNTLKTYQFKTSSDLISVVSKSKGQTLSLTVKRQDNEFNTELVPRLNYPPDQGPTGVVITDLEFKKYPFYQAPFKATYINLERSVLMLTGIGKAVYDLVLARGGQTDIAGPIGIAQITGKAVQFGFKSLLEFVSILSLNLAVLNILPFPALDGGRLLFVFIEKVIGRKVRPAFEKQTHQLGMLILLFLVLLVSINDIMRIVRGG